MLPRQGKVKGIHHHEALMIWNVSGTYPRKRRSKLWTVKWQQTHNSQQPNLKTQKQTKQTTRTTESQKGRSHGRLSAGRGRMENGEKGTGIRSINGSRYRVDRERLRTA